MSEDNPREGFLGRWSRRKRAEPTTREEDDAKAAAALAAERERTAPQTVQPRPVEPPPDLPAVETLTPDSDYTRFMKPDVPIASRNAAMKKLFTDPHFNVMDGLDIYIDDYTKEDPIPMAMLRDLAQSKMLGLFKEEEAQEEKARQELADQTAAALEGDAADVVGGVEASDVALETATQPGATPALTADAAGTHVLPSVDALPAAPTKASSEAMRAEPYNPAASTEPSASSASPASSSLVGRPDSA